MNGNSNITLSVIKGTFWAVSCSLLCVLGFAFVLKFTPLSESLISPINQGIKIFSIALGCFVLSKKVKSRTWLWGAILGVCYTLLSFIIFSILDGEFSFNLSLLTDCLFAAVIGLICALGCNLIRK